MIYTADKYEFDCTTDIERRRVKTMFTKEPGTIRWLRETLRPGDVFADVGANIGLYTVLAADLVGKSGCVYAFEPLAANAAALMRNVYLNKVSEPCPACSNQVSDRISAVISGSKIEQKIAKTCSICDGRLVVEKSLADRVNLLTVALADYSGYSTFSCPFIGAGSSGGQLGHLIGEDGKAFKPKMREIKRAESLWSLAEQIGTPDVVKIDVDGNEFMILRGFNELRPRSVQIETHPKDADKITELMREYGYDLKTIHYTNSGQRLLDSGTPAVQIIHNAIYERTPT